MRRKTGREPWAAPRNSKMQITELSATTKRRGIMCGVVVKEKGAEIACAEVLIVKVLMALAALAREIFGGENEQAFPAGKPVQDRSTEPLKPEEEATVTETLLAVEGRVIEDGLTLMVKSVIFS
jgi:hypothetical protein